MIKCGICNIETSNRKYCSRSCVNKAKLGKHAWNRGKTKRGKNCLVCGEYTTNKKFCSSKCSYEGRNINRRGNCGEKNGMYGKGYLVAGEKNGMYNRHHTEKSREKMSERQKGRSSYIRTPEIKAKNRLSNLGRVVTEETRGRISKTLTGRKYGKRRCVSKLKGKTYEEIYGIKRAKVLKEKRKTSRIYVKKYFDTKPELLFESNLNSIGMKFGIDYFKQHPVKGIVVDFYIPKAKLCVFVDGDFFHRNPKEYDEMFKIFGKTSREIWDKDFSQTKKLRESGYRVFRIWGSDMESGKLKKELYLFKCGFTRFTDEKGYPRFDLMVAQSGEPGTNNCSVYSGYSAYFGTKGV